MKVLQLVSRVDEEADGVASAVLDLTSNMQNEGYGVNLACATPKNNRMLPSGVLTANSTNLLRWDLNWGLISKLKTFSNEFDIIHNHGLWNPVNIAAGYLIPRHGCKLVCSPHGTLTEWAMNHSARKKKILWPLQRQVLENASLIHVTSQSEYLDVRRLGFKNPIALINLGISLPHFVEVKPCSNSKTLLFLSRIHEKKGVDNLLRSWKEIQEQFPCWSLKIVGKGDESYVDNVKCLAKKLGLERVQFCGPVYGVDKINLYKSSDLFILPTFSENFGIVVAEALSCSVPVVVGKGAPWEDVIKNNCGWWVDNSVEALVKILQKAMRLDNTVLSEMGISGREWMQRDFCWRGVVGKMHASYEWLFSKTNKPDWIILD